MQPISLCHNSLRFMFGSIFVPHLHANYLCKYAEDYCSCGLTSSVIHTFAFGRGVLRRVYSAELSARGDLIGWI